MRTKEFKLHLLKVEGELCSTGSCDGWQGDALSTARNIAKLYERHPAELNATLIENWHHKVGRSWRITETPIGTWTLGELRAGNDIE